MGLVLTVWYGLQHFCWHSADYSEGIHI